MEKTTNEMHVELIEALEPGEYLVAGYYRTFNGELYATCITFKDKEEKKPSVLKKFGGVVGASISGAASMIMGRKFLLENPQATDGEIEAHVSCHRGETAPAGLGECVREDRDPDLFGTWWNNGA